MRYVVADFETASRADLQKIGAWKNLRVSWPAAHNQKGRLWIGV